MPGEDGGVVKASVETYGPPAGVSPPAKSDIRAKNVKIAPLTEKAPNGVWCNERRCGIR